MATLTTLVDGDIATVAPVNANFVALNTDLVKTGTCLYAAVGSVANVSTTETDLMSFTLPASTFVAVGDFLVVRASFAFATPSTVGTVKFYVGTAHGTVNVTTTSPALGTGMIVDLVATCTSITGSGAAATRGVAFTYTNLAATSPVLEAAGDIFATTSLTNPWSIAQTVKFTGTAAGGSNLIFQTKMHAIAYRG